MITVPGIIYSLLLALGAWAVDYFTTGGGEGIPWAPILLATVPIILKMFTVQASVSATPAAASRSLNPYDTELQGSKTQRFIFG